MINKNSIFYFLRIFGFISTTTRFISLMRKLFIKLGEILKKRKERKKMNLEKWL